MKTSLRVSKASFRALLLTVCFLLIPVMTRAELTPDDFNLFISGQTQLPIAQPTPSTLSIPVPSPSGSSTSSAFDLSTLSSLIQLGSTAASGGQYAAGLNGGTLTPNSFGNVISGTALQREFAGTGTGLNLISGALNLYTGTTDPSKTVNQQIGAGVGATADTLLAFGIPTLGTGAALALGAPAVVAGGAGLLVGTAYSLFGSQSVTSGVESGTASFLNSFQQGQNITPQLTSLPSVSVLPQFPAPTPPPTISTQPVVSPVIQTGDEICFE